MLFYDAVLLDTPGERVSHQAVAISLCRDGSVQCARGGCGGEVGEMADVEI